MIQLTDSALTLVDVNLRQNSNAFDLINVTAPVSGAASVLWRGYCMLDQNDGGAGFAISVPDSALVTLTDDGYCYVTRAAAAEMFSVGTNVALARRGLGEEVAVAFVGTAAAIDILGGAGVGPPGNSRSLRVLTTVWCGKTGTAGNDSITVTVENETTGLSATALCDTSVGLGTRSFQEVALSDQILHAPGQPLRITLALTGGGAPTDVRVAVG